MTSSTVTSAFAFTDPDDKLGAKNRLMSLRKTGLLDARRRLALDAITRLAAQTTAASSAAVSLVTSDRQIHPSTYRADGLPTESDERPISHSLCQFVVINDAPLVVEDARAHPVLSQHPAVLEDGVVSYAGLPLHDPDGEVLGALCVVDVVPRQWTEDQLVGLGDLVTAVETKIALGLSRREVHLDHQRLLSVLDGAAHTMIVLADSEGVVTMMNRAAALALNHDTTAIVGAWTLSDLTRIARPEVASPSASLGGGTAKDWTLEAADGSHRVISVQVNIVRDVIGEVEAYVVVGDDVSARRRAEHLLRDTVEQQGFIVKHLEALDAARSGFIATASHELRTPVTSILGYTELLADGAAGELSTAQSGMIDRVDRNSRRLLDLIEDLLNLARIDATASHRVRPLVDVVALASQAWEGLRPELVGRDLVTSVSVSRSSIVVSADPLQLERALLNLLSNAVKFTPDGGSVGLDVRSHDVNVIFEVTDTGLGIAADEHDAVFDPFYRSQSSHARATPGSGIGLSLVRRIAEDHGGTVQLESVLGQGTTVTLTIPSGGCVSA